MNKKKILLLGALLLAGCASQPPLVGPLPYDFQAIRVEDARPDDDAKLMSAEAFGAEKLVAAWRRQVARSVWGSTPAELKIRVTQYEATHSGHSYALSLAAELVALQPGTGINYRTGGLLLVKPLAAQCTAQVQSMGGRGGAAIAHGLFGADAPQGGGEGSVRGLSALTVTGRDATLWQELWNQCARQLATQFTQALMAVGS